MNIEKKSIYFITFTISFMTTWFFTLEEKLININFYQFEHTLQPLRGRSGCETVVLAILLKKKESIQLFRLKLYKTNQICTSLI